jgi:hypothetical protein
MGATSVSVAAAVNKPEVLANCLARSPDVRAGRLPLRSYSGFASAALAYNRGLDESEADIVVFAHQDVYLPEGFLDGLRIQLDLLDRRDPDWAICGVIGIDPEGRVRGQTWSSGIGKLVGEPLEEPAEVVTLDEVLLVMRKASGLRFDEAMPAFHLYAADAVQAARSAGIGAYAASLPIIHHSRPVVSLDAGYRAAYRHMQRKWRAELPLPNLVCPIHRSSLPLLHRDLRIRWRNRGRPRRPEPTSDPSEIARRLGLEKHALAGA